jgi:hypothetical protein
MAVAEDKEPEYHRDGPGIKRSRKAGNNQPGGREPEKTVNFGAAAHKLPLVKNR